MKYAIAVLFLSAVASAQSVSTISPTDAADLDKLMADSPPVLLEPAAITESVCVQQTCFRYHAFSITDPDTNTTTYWVGPNGLANGVCTSTCGTSAYCPVLQDDEELAIYQASTSYCGGCGDGQRCLPHPSDVYAYCNVQTAAALSSTHCQINGGGGTGGSGDGGNGGEQ